MTREILGWSVIAIFAAIGLVFLIALHCWLTGSDNPLDEDADTDCIGGAGLRWVDEEDGRIGSADRATRASPRAPTGLGHSAGIDLREGR